MLKNIVGITMAQMGKYNAHLSAIKVVLLEYTQIEDNTVFDRMDISKLTPERKMVALNILTFIKKTWY